MSTRAAKFEPESPSENGVHPAGSFALRRSLAREKSRTRLELRVARPVENKERRFAPLKESRASKSALLRRAAVYLASAAAVHAAVVFGLLAFGDNDGAPLIAPKQSVEKVMFRVVEPTPAKAEKVPDLEKPAVETEPVQEPLVPRPPVEAPKRPAKKQALTPPDPVDMAQKAPEPETKPRRRIVGISYESTVSAGPGPSFAVGNTRMGATEREAQNPSDAEKLGAGDSKSYAGPGAGSGPNRAAAATPDDNIIFVKPKRISNVALDYPSALKARGLEGNVVMLIRIDSSGKVSSAKVIGSSGYSEFDEAARRAAAKEVFAPAMRGGEPVEYNLKYTYRFRIRES